MLPTPLRGHGQPFEIAVNVNGEHHRFLVLADAAPTAEDLQTMTEETALPRSPHVDVQLECIRVIERAIADPRYKDRVVLLDLNWTIAKSLNFKTG